MRIAFSNLAWDIVDDRSILNLLASAGIRGLELAPAKVFGELIETRESQAKEYRKFAEDAGLEIVAFQAYLFGHPELKLFDDSSRQAFIDFTKKTIEIAAWCGASRLVYGAPKSRDRLGRDMNECKEIAAKAFLEIGEFATGHDVVFCLEPNPPSYNCNFASNAAEAAELVRLVDSSGFRLHLDSACMTLAGDDIADSIDDNDDILAHFHASEPELGDFSAPTIDHETAAQSLKSCDYEGWVSIEMKPPQKAEDDIRRAAAFVLETYGD
jgi:sugar phosphate isomerase/epimerase